MECNLVNSDCTAESLDCTVAMTASTLVMPDFLMECTVVNWGSTEDCSGYRLAKLDCTVEMTANTMVRHLAVENSASTEVMMESTVDCLDCTVARLDCR